MEKGGVIIRKIHAFVNLFTKIQNARSMPGREEEDTMAAFVSKLCGVMALGGMIWWGSTKGPSDHIDEFDEKRALLHLADEGYEECWATDIDRWFTSWRHQCPADKSIAVQTWAHDAYGTLHSITVCCDAAASPNSCAVVR